MDLSGASVIVGIYSNMDVFALVFLRILGFIVIMPIFSGQTIPMMVKIGLAFCFSALAVTSGVITAPEITGGVWGYFLLAAQEFLTGFLIGFVVYMMFAVFYYVGQLVDYQIGFSMVSVYDPISEIQAPITGNLYYFIFLVYYIVTGGLNILLYQMFDTYRMFPPGQAFIIGNSGLMTGIIGMITGYLELGFKIAMPIVAAILIMDVALGILVKAVPQMNVFVVGMPAKLFAGLFIMYLTIPTLENIVYSPFYENLLENVIKTITGMVPG